MQEPITVNYVPDGEDWNVTVSVAGRDDTRKARASGLIAARDRADQLVEQLAPNATSRTVVHLLEGDAYAFTTTYLHARLGLEPVGGSEQTPKERPAEVVAVQQVGTPVQQTDQPADAVR